MDKFSGYAQNLIMRDVYVEIVDYIQNNNVSFSEVLQIYGGIGYSDTDIKFLYDVAVEHLGECEELNNRKQK